MDSAKSTICGKGHRRSAWKVSVTNSAKQDFRAAKLTVLGFLAFLMLVFLFLLHLFG